ncbi:MAG: hypothetical protein JJE22_02745 [Bacteroidia bacterium]|nr:hypothetical protein [Bacteroidia bacterium]
MKKNFFLFSLSLSLLLTGCLETTQEITINADGSGMLTNTNDMSALMSMIKQVAGKEGAKFDDGAIDTTLSLSSQADSIVNVTPEEKEMIKKGSLILKMKEDAFIIGIKFPFASMSEINVYNDLTNKIMYETIKNELGNTEMAGLEDMPPPTSIEDYFTTSFSSGSLVKTLNKEKYAKIADDEFLKGMKESATMGLPMTATYIINLPKPAKIAEGKNLKLSEDKKRVTIVANIDDFYDDPTKLEYKIEY